MISISEIWAKHGEHSHGRLTTTDLKKSATAKERNDGLQRGNKFDIVKKPSSRTITGFKSAKKKINNIKQIKLGRRKIQGKPYR
jgi:hypothetical protein